MTKYSCPIQSQFHINSDHNGLSMHGSGVHSCSSLTRCGYRSNCILLAKELSYILMLWTSLTDNIEERILKMFLSLHKIFHGWFINVLVHQGNVPKSKTTGKLCDYLGIMSNVGSCNAHSWRSPIWSSQIRVALNFKTAREYFTHRSLMQDSHKWQKDNLFIYSKSWAIWWFHPINTGVRQLSQNHKS